MERDALGILLKRYQPALLSFLCRVQKMSEEEAAELLQAFVSDKVLEYQLLRHAQEGRGRFRTFLLTSLKRFAVDQFRSRERLLDTQSGMSPRPSTPDADALVQAAWARALIHGVLESMRRECETNDRMDIWKVFECRIVKPLFESSPTISYEELAKACQITSPTQAANLLVTGKRMYARLLRQAVAEYEMRQEEIDHEIDELSILLSVSNLD